jgi:hypothetical protein
MSESLAEQQSRRYALDVLDRYVVPAITHVLLHAISAISTASYLTPNNVQGSKQHQVNCMCWGIGSSKKRH